MASKTTSPLHGTAAIVTHYQLHPQIIAHFDLGDALHPSISSGTVIPVFHNGIEVARRFKSDPFEYKRRGIKYYWLGSRRFDVYHLDAVKTNEPAILTAGEPDTWTLYQAGLNSFSFLKGEGCIPSEGLRLVVDRHPSLITIIYDLDDAGRTGALKAYHTFTAAGLCAEIAELPANLGEKGDVSDLYAHLGYDDAQFRDAIANLPRHCPPAQPAQPVRVRSASGEPAGASIFERVKAAVDIVAIAARLTDLAERQGGRYFIGRCPFHDDRHPSFVVWPEIGGFRCMGCGIKGDTITLAQLMMDRGLL